jgi:twitching motility protein PilT
MNWEIYRDKLLEAVVRSGASDLHITVGRKPMVRIDGSLIAIEGETEFTPETARECILTLLTPSYQKRLEEHRDTDFSYNFRDRARFRINVYYQRGYLAAALRYISATILTVEELHLPTILHHFAKLKQGFFIVAGPAGEGKSTTLSAILDEINHTRTDHIITIEDPIEYLFAADRSNIGQRELGSDTFAFADALRATLRQDPDVIMVGEMRDIDTIATAITAAETGHLVLTSLHTNSAAQTIDRIIDAFPSSQQNQVRAQLANTLVGVVSQRLIPRVQGGRIPAVEVMLTNHAIRTLVRENKTHQINLVIETSAEEGMMTLNRSLADLVKRNEIKFENADLYSLNSAELGMLLEKR